MKLKCPQKKAQHFCSTFFYFAAPNIVLSNQFNEELLKFASNQEIKLKCFSLAENF